MVGKVTEAMNRGMLGDALRSQKREAAQRNQGEQAPDFLLSIPTIVINFEVIILWSNSPLLPKFWLPVHPCLIGIWRPSLEEIEKTSFTNFSRQKVSTSRAVPPFLGIGRSFKSS